MASGLEAVIERQMRNWELSRQQASEPAQGAPAETVHHFVSVSRQLGSGGDAIARTVGRELGWQVYNREILDYMAEKDAVQRRLYALQDERHEGWLESIMNALTRG